MANENVVTANLKGGWSCVTAPLWQWDYGQVLEITGIDDLPSSFAAHCANRWDGSSQTVLGSNGRLSIPNDLLTSGEPVYVWIILTADGTDGETKYKITIPVNRRAAPTDYPTTAQQSAITQAINALNTAAANAAAEVAAELVDPTLAVSGKAADAAKTGEELSNLKSDLTHTQKSVFLAEKSITDITSAGYWTLGQGVAVASGSNFNNSKYCRTGYIAIPSPLLIVMDSTDYEFFVYEYEGALWSSYTFAPKPGYDKSPVLVTSDHSSNYFRIGVRRVDEEDMSSTDVNVIRLAIKTFIFTDTTLSVSGASADAKVTGDRLNEKVGYVRALGHATDLDDVSQAGTYSWNKNDLPTNVPVNESAFLTVLQGFHTNNRAQYVSTFTGKFFQRVQYVNGTWAGWFEISGNRTTVENTYNITTSPTITTDSNGWLQSVDTDTADETGKTDMTGAIMSMLTDTGYCHLGEGIFYVSGNIDMPEGSMLCGCGKKTVVRLLQSTTTGYCVKIEKYCTIENISFEGARTFAVPSTKGTRNGIAFMADYDGTPSITTDHCMVNNVWCKFFSGAGIYCHNTSINYAKGLYVSNAYIYACYAGIDIDYYSEFNRFVNVCTAWGKYGCINNGGNNSFTSCVFHATEIGFYVDGSQPNSAHGVLDSCEFAHIGSNNGCAIKMEDVANGYTISNCQFGYSWLEFSDCAGINITGCHFIRGTASDNTTIVITNGKTIMINGCMFNITPVITITNNTKVKFDACYELETGNAVTA